MAILTIKLSAAQRDAVATAVRFALAQATAAGSEFAPDLREALSELTERARDYAAEDAGRFPALADDQDPPPRFSGF
jgi:hypothetical protein